MQQGLGLVTKSIDVRGLGFTLRLILFLLLLIICKVSCSVAQVQTGDEVSPCRTARQSVSYVIRGRCCVKNYSLEMSLRGKYVKAVSIISIQSPWRATDSVAFTPTWPATALARSFNDLGLISSQVKRYKNQKLVSSSCNLWFWNAPA